MDLVINNLTKEKKMSTYRTNYELILYIVLDNKLLNKLSKQYKSQVDKMYNEEEKVQARKIKTKIGKEFLIPVNDSEELAREFDIEAYVERNMQILKQDGLKYFLQSHGWSLDKLYAYLTNASSLLRPVTEVSFI